MSTKAQWLVIGLLIVLVLATGLNLFWNWSRIDNQVGCMVDAQAGVVCWNTAAGGIDCLPMIMRDMLESAGP